MSEPEWLHIDIILDFHAEQLALFGGPDGIRDLGLLEPALARPVNKFAYGQTSFAALAAAYGFGIAQNHPFIDGNKRTALTSVIVFLGLNGYGLETTEDEIVETFMRLADGKFSGRNLAKWIREHMQQAPPDTTPSEAAG